MTCKEQLKIAHALGSEALHVAWQQKWLWGYSVLSLGACGVLFITGAVVSHFANATGSWFIWFAPELQVPFSISTVTIKMFFVALATFINMVILAVIMQRLVKYFAGTPSSFADSFRFESLVRIRVFSVAFVAAIVAVMMVIPISANPAILIGLRIFWGIITWFGFFIIPGLIKDHLLLWPAICRSINFTGRYIVTLLWAFFLYSIFTALICFAIFASAMVVAKVLGLLLGWSAFVTLIPFALLGSGFMVGAFLYLMIAWAIFSLRAYAYFAAQVRK